MTNLIQHRLRQPIVKLARQHGGIVSDWVAQHLEQERTVAADEIESLRNALTRARRELAALVPNPAEVSVDDWPLKSSADRACVDAAWRILTYSLSRESESPIFEPISKTVIDMKCFSAITLNTVGGHGQENGTDYGNG